MGRIMLVTSGKGGTGKSTVALNLALSLAQEGKKAVVLELDSGLRCLDLMLGIDSIVYDLGDIMSGRCEALAAVYQSELCENLSLIAAPSSSTQKLDGERFSVLCKYLARKFDFVILDTPAGIGQSLSLAAKVSSSAVIVTNVSPVSIRDAEKAVGIVADAGVKNMRLVVNMIPLEVSNKNLIPDFDDIIDRVGVQLLALIPDDEVLRKSVVERTKKENKKSIGILAFSNMAKRVLGRDIPLLIK